MNLLFNHRKVIKIKEHFSKLLFNGFKEFYSVDYLPFFIAGGSIRAFYAGELNKRDIDIVPKTQKGKEQLLNFIQVKDLRKNLILDILSIQPSMEVFSSGVTFTVATGCLDDTQLVYHPHFFNHIAARKISFNEKQTMAKTPESALKRAFKYAKDNYYLEEEEITKILNHFKNP